jgi:hypothetical protein
MATTTPVEDAARAEVVGGFTMAQVPGVVWAAVVAAEARRGAGTGAHRKAMVVAAVGAILQEAVAAGQILQTTADHAMEIVPESVDVMIAISNGKMPNLRPFVEPANARSGCGLLAACGRRLPFVGCCGGAADSDDEDAAPLEPIVEVPAEALPAEPIVEVPAEPAEALPAEPSVRAPAEARPDGPIIVVDPAEVTFAPAEYTDV